MTAIQQFREAGAALIKYRAEMFPIGTLVRVDAAQFKGLGIAAREDGTNADQLAVRLENGNTWWYPIDDCKPAETQFSTCARNKWYKEFGKHLRANGWRLRTIPPKWDEFNALIERGPKPEGG